LSGQLVFQEASKLLSQTISAGRFRVHATAKYVTDFWLPLGVNSPRIVLHLPRSQDHANRLEFETHALHLLLKFLISYFLVDRENEKRGNGRSEIREESPPSWHVSNIVYRRSLALACSEMFAVAPNRDRYCDKWLYLGADSHFPRPYASSAIC
jgi:hypothetical protein